MRLRQSVDRVRQQLGLLVRLVVDLVALLVQPEVGREVDHLQAALAQRAHHTRRRAVRIGDQRRLGARRDRVGVELLQQQWYAVARIQIGVLRPDVRARGDGDQFQRRMPVDDVRGQRARICTCSYDGDPMHAAALPARRSGPR